MKRFIKIIVNITKFQRIVKHNFAPNAKPHLWVDRATNRSLNFLEFWKHSIFKRSDRPPITDLLLPNNIKCHHIDWEISARQVFRIPTAFRIVGSNHSAHHAFSAQTPATSPEKLCTPATLPVNNLLPASVTRPINGREIELIVTTQNSVDFLRWVH